MAITCARHPLDLGACGEASARRRQTAASNRGSGDGEEQHAFPDATGRVEGRTAWLPQEGQDLGAPSTTRISRESHPMVTRPRQAAFSSALLPASGSATAPAKPSRCSPTSAPASPSRSTRWPLVPPEPLARGTNQPHSERERDQDDDKPHPDAVPVGPASRDAWRPRSSIQ
jgi:hypothetical protein